MKKLLFTAIAVIAFSGVAMAETIELKFVENHEMFVLPADNCQTFAMDFIDEYDCSNPGEEMDAITANNVFQELLNMCYTNMG